MLKLMISIMSFTNVSWIIRIIRHLYVYIPELISFILSRLLSQRSFELLEVTPELLSKLETLLCTLFNAFIMYFERDTLLWSIINFFDIINLLKTKLSRFFIIPSHSDWTLIENLHRIVILLQSRQSPQFIWHFFISHKTQTLISFLIIEFHLEFVFLSEFSWSWLWGTIWSSISAFSICMNSIAERICSEDIIIFI